MAGITLKTPGVFPPGTNVTPYAATNWPSQVTQPSGAPLGSGAAAAVAVANDGSIDFTASGLTAGKYYAVAQIGGVWKYLGFTVGQDIDPWHDIAHETDLDAEEAARAAADATHTAADASEAAARAAADLLKQDAATAATDAEVAAAVAAEATARSTGDTAEATARDAAIATHNSALDRHGMQANDAWTAPTFTNSWGHLNAANAAYAPVAYRKNRLGQVELRGTAYKAATGSDGIFTLPAGYRPSKNLQFGPTVAGSFYGITVQSDGVVKRDVAEATAPLDVVKFDPV